MTQVYTRTALGNVNDLVTPTATPQYKLGEVVVIEEPDTLRPNILAEYIYIKNLQTPLTAFVPGLIFLTEIIDEEYVVSVANPITDSTFPIRTVCVPQIQIELGFFGFVKIKGVATVLLDGVTTGSISVGSDLQLQADELTLQFAALNAETSCGISLTATSSASVEGTVLLNGVLVAIPIT